MNETTLFDIIIVSFATISYLFGLYGIIKAMRYKRESNKSLGMPAYKNPPPPPPKPKIKHEKESIEIHYIDGKILKIDCYDRHIVHKSRFLMLRTKQNALFDIVINFNNVRYFRTFNPQTLSHE